MNLVAVVDHKFLDTHEPFVRPARDGHGFVSKEKFHASAVGLAEIRNAEGFQVGLEHIAAGGLVEPVENDLIGYRLEVVDHLAAQKAASAPSAARYTMRLAGVPESSSVISRVASMA